MNDDDRSGVDLHHVHKELTWRMPHFWHYKDYFCLPLTLSITFGTFRIPGSFHPMQSPLSSR
jgi:hypothetical protein